MLIIFLYDIYNNLIHYLFTILCYNLSYSALLLAESEMRLSPQQTVHHQICLTPFRRYNLISVPDRGSLPCALCRQAVFFKYCTGFLGA